MQQKPSGTIGVYQIVAAIGAGGMGEVYRARDTKLNRDVAIKVLPELFALDPERLARFMREAQTLAALNHSNIAQIYGVVDLPADGGRHGSALVMELADGEDLSALIARGPLPLADALAIARQIAHALEAAHEQGIVHRDLKPANVKVKPDGTVKVLDFGLAKAMDPVAGPEGPACTAMNSPTFTAHATEMGVILGTAAYMAPEQARGKAVDKRADIWAFGVVLFEMLTGRQLFDGDTISEVMASVMKDDPDWSRLPPATPPQVLRLLRRCLVKDPKQRLRDIGDARLLLDDTDTPVPSRVDSRGPRPRSIGVLPAVSLALVCIVATAAAVRLWWPRGLAAATVGGSPHLQIVLPGDDEITKTEMAPLAISPDGTRIAYTAVRDGRAQLYERELGATEPTALPGTEGAGTPFFSPDGQWIGFFTKDKLKKVAIGGTAVQVLCDAGSARGGSWGRDGQIYFAPTMISGILKVSDAGGTPVEVTHLDRAHGEISHRWPVMLSDGKTLLFTIWTGPGYDERQIVRLSVPTGERQVLVRGGDNAKYLADGYLLYVHLDDLFAIPWRPSDAVVRSTAPIALHAHARVEYEGAGAYDVSTDGTLISLTGGAARYEQRLVWVDRGGRVEPLPLPLRDYEAAWISPDGSQALVQTSAGTVGLSLYDFARHTLTPLATGAGSSQAGTWTPDGKSIIYRGTRNGTRDLYRRAADGTGVEEQLTVGDDMQTPAAVSPDGRWLVLTGLGGKYGSGRLMAIRLDGSMPATPQLIAGDGAMYGQISPDGKWIAFSAPISDRMEIYVQPFPGPGPRKQISTDGGLEPLWSRGGQELFYQNSDRLMGVEVSASPSSFSAGQPRLIAQGRFRPAPNSKTAFDVATDGRFLRVQPVEPERPLNRIDVVLNWISELRAAATQVR
jgi:serine/threonine-protein kinase